MKSIGLAMIVRDEAAIVRRCLDSVRPLVDYAVIVDTGSRDRTIEVVRGWLAEVGLPGVVISEPWRDFGTNRSQSLEHLRGQSDIDYALVIDADDVLVVDPGFDPARFKAALDGAYYDVEIRRGLLKYWRPQLVSNKVGFGYKGVLYEFLVGPRYAGVFHYAAGFHIVAGEDGVRRRNPDRARDDAAILAEALEGETDPIVRARYTFYLALSYMEAGDHGKALEFFLKRAALDVWPPERALSLHHAARMMETLHHPDTEIIGTYLKAYEADPTRIEPLHLAMRYCRLTDKPHQGHLIGKQAITLAEPAHGLYVESWMYDYGALEEFSIAAYRAGHYADCIAAIEKLLADRKIPQSAWARLRENARAAAAKLAA